MTILGAFGRLDLLLPLLTAHLLADFVFQTDRMAAGKDRRGVLLGHVGVVAAASWLLVSPTATGLPLILLVALFHLLIDLAKIAVERGTLGPEPGGAPGPEPAGFWPRNGRPTLFLADQALHAASLIAAVVLIERLPVVSTPSPGTGVWISAFGTPYLRLLILASGGIVATTGVGYFFAHFLARFEIELDPDQRGGLPGGGYWIGVTERSLIYLFILLGEPTGIGFLAAAKSVFRIGELKDSKDRKLAEYILIGTLLSFAVAMLVGLVARRMLDLVR
ncbi:MAG: DUF3307 domain-containing protein [Longimicrobiales bacterium]|nr:DUF3307 domain-containing protein [Longimicrobiales bacterium]